MKTLKSFSFKQARVVVSIERYGNGRPAIVFNDVTDGLPYLTATMNCNKDVVDTSYVIIKDYSENEGVYNFLVENNIIAPAHAEHCLAFDTAPICELLPYSEWKELEEPDWDVYGEQMKSDDWYNQ